MFSILEVMEDTIDILVNSKYNEYFIIKGGIALTSAVCGMFQESMRRTTDIDMFYSNHNSWESLVNEIEYLLNSDTKLDLKYKLIQRRGFDKNPYNDSLDLTAHDKQNNKFNFSIDMNINVREPEFEIYNTPIFNIAFRGYTLNEMLADKMYVFGNRVVNRRIKDIYDIYLISRLSKFNCIDISNFIKTKWLASDKKLEELYFLGETGITEMKHAWDRFDMGIDKPKFEDVMSRDIDFTMPIYNKIMCNVNNKCEWNNERGVWLYDNR